MGTSAKVCIRCHQDCSKKPRTKDLEGHYTCRECFEKAAAKAKSRPEPALAAAVGYDDDAALMASLLDDNSGSPAVHVGTIACPNCGHGMASGAVVCVTCGYNKATGHAAAVSVQSAPRGGGGGVASGAGALAASAAGAMASGSMIIVGAVVASCIAGGIGAGIWAAIAYNTGYEIGWIAWGVGILAGLGAAIGSRGNTGMFTGGVAVVVAIVAILGGKYITADMVVGDVARQVAAQIEITDEDAIAMIARGIVAEHQSANRRVIWPEDVDPEYAFEEADFPTSIWKDASGRWARLSAEDRAAYHSAAEREYRAMFDTAVLHAKDEVFLSTFGILDILFFGLAIFSAAGIGAGGSIGGDDD